MFPSHGQVKRQTSGVKSSHPSGGWGWGAPTPGSVQSQSEEAAQLVNIQTDSQPPRSAGQPGWQWWWGPGAGRGGGRDRPLGQLSLAYTGSSQHGWREGEALDITARLWHVRSLQTDRPTDRPTPACPHSMTVVELQGLEML